MTDWSDLPSSETVHRLPESHWHCHLHNFDWGAVVRSSDKQRAVRGFLDAVAAGEHRNLLMLGRQGGGKTHLAVGIYRWAVARWDLSRATFLHVPTVSVRTKERFDDPDLPDPMAPLETARLVVLDDPFGREPTDWERQQIIPRIIDTVYQRRASAIMTANHDLKEFAAFLHPHELSRLQEDAAVLDFFNDRDYRTRRDR